MKGRRMKDLLDPQSGPRLPAEASLISSPLGGPTGPATPRLPVSFAAASEAPEHYHGERRAQLVGR